MKDMPGVHSKLNVQVIGGEQVAAPTARADTAYTATGRPFRLSRRLRSRLRLTTAAAAIPDGPPRRASPGRAEGPRGHRGDFRCAAELR